MLQNKTNFLNEFWDVAHRVNLAVTFVFEANQHSFISKIPQKYFRNNRIRIEFFPGGNDDDILFSNDFMQFTVELNSIIYSVKAGFNTIQQIYDSETMEKLYFNEECLEKLKERAKTSASQDTAANVITPIKVINGIKLKEEYINKCVGSSQDQIWRHIQIVRKAASTDINVESGDQSDCLGAWIQRVMNDPRCITDYGNGMIMWQSLFPHVLKLDLYSTTYKATIFLILFGVELNNKTMYEIKIKAIEKEYEIKKEIIKNKSRKIKEEIRSLKQNLWEKHLKILKTYSAKANELDENSKEYDNQRNEFKKIIDKHFKKDVSLFQKILEQVDEESQQLGFLWNEFHKKKLSLLDEKNNKKFANESLLNEEINKMLDDFYKNQKVEF